MHIERGPQGKVVVFELIEGVEVVEHALLSMRNYSLPQILPLYLREVCGRKQLCSDCTELISLSDATLANDLSTDQLRKEFSSFLDSVLHLEDYYISRDFLIMDPQYVFFDKQHVSFFWCCIPVSPTAGVLYDKDSCFEERMNTFLSSSFITSLFTGQRIDRLREAMHADNESSYAEILLSPSSEGTPCPEKKISRAPSLPFLAVHLTVMIITLLFLLCGNDIGVLSIRPIHWISIFVLVFGLSLLSILLFTHRVRNDDPAVLVTRMTTKEIPAVQDKPVMKGPSISYPKAFLQLMHEGNDPPGKNRKRFPILVNDFLIGRDALLCDLFLDDKSISDRHARIVKREGTYFVLDIGSTTGSRLGDRILYSFEESPLMDGDLVSFGDIRFQFLQYT